VGDVVVSWGGSDPGTGYRERDQMLRPALDGHIGVLVED